MDPVRLVKIILSSAAFQFGFMVFAIVIIDGPGPSNEMRHQLLPNNTNSRRCCICHPYHIKRHFISYTLLTRWSALV